jgi:hypothetical protein
MNLDFDADLEPAFDFYADPDPLLKIIQILADPDLQHFLEQLTLFVLNFHKEGLTGRLR